VGQKSDTARTLHYTVREVSLFWPTMYIQDTRHTGLNTPSSKRTYKVGGQSPTPKSGSSDPPSLPKIAPMVSTVVWWPE